jgi:hypothetical protein
MSHQVEVKQSEDRWTWVCSCGMSGSSYDTEQGARSGGEDHRTMTPP